jgi:GH15 family glucan-1,4-alpha-glucosidase
MATDDQLRHLVARSVEVIADHQDVGGAYPASPTFPVYRFSWLRDGAFIADAMSRVAQRESATRFFDWCARTIVARADHVQSLVDRSHRGERIGADEHLPTRFTITGDDSGEEWWDFQLDGYGTWIWALDQHRRRHAATAARLDPTTQRAVELCVDYLATFWHEPCFDWWEEHADGVHTSTLAAVHAGLRSAATILGTGVRSTVARQATDDIALFVGESLVADGHLIKMVGDARVDASLIAALTPFRTVAPRGPLADATYQRIVSDLAPDGVHRYLGDTYFGGGRWVVLAGLVGWHEAATGRAERARARLDWMYDRATDDGLLPEQVTDITLDPTMIEPWVEKWGPVATPLLWSHAMYLTLANELGLTP